MKRIFTLLLAFSLTLPAISQEPVVPEENKAEEAAKAAKAAEAPETPELKPRGLKKALKFLMKKLLIKSLTKPSLNPTINGVEIPPMLSAK